MSKVQISNFLSTHNQLVHATAGLSEEQLKWKAAPTSWSITEVLAHLADHSIVVSFRIRDILAATTCAAASLQSGHLGQRPVRQ